MAFTLIYGGEDRVDELERRVSEIGTTLSGIFEEAGRLGISPAEAAERRVESVLKRA